MRRAGVAAGRQRRAKQLNTKEENKAATAECEQSCPSIPSLTRCQGSRLGFNLAASCIKICLWELLQMCVR